MMTPNGGVFGRHPRFDTVTVANGITMTAGNLVVASGNGIDFSATSGTGTTELLNDYEEGNWSPVYVPSGGSFATMTMDVLGAKYVKIGRMVMVTAHVRTDNVDATGATGAVSVSGLPFAAASTGRYAFTISSAEDFAGDFPRAGSLYESRSQIDLYYRTTANTADLALVVADMQAGALGNRNDIYITGTYTTA